jgi:hypothetical protein
MGKTLEVWAKTQIKAPICKAAQKSYLVYRHMTDSAAIFLQIFNHVLKSRKKVRNGIAVQDLFSYRVPVFRDQDKSTASETFNIKLIR